MLLRRPSPAQETTPAQGRTRPQRVRPERGLSLLADRVEVDAQRLQGRGVRVPESAYLRLEIALSEAELTQHDTALRVAGEHAEQEVLGPHLLVPESTGM